MFKLIGLRVLVKRLEEEANLLYKEGDIVVFAKYNRTDITIDRKEYDDILGKIEK